MNELNDDDNNKQGRQKEKETYFSGKERKRKGKKKYPNQLINTECCSSMTTNLVHKKKIGQNILIYTLYVERIAVVSLIGKQ